MATSSIERAQSDLLFLQTVMGKLTQVITRTNELKEKYRARTTDIENLRTQAAQIGSKHRAQLSQAGSVLQATVDAASRALSQGIVDGSSLDVERRRLNQTRMHLENTADESHPIMLQMQQVIKEQEAVKKELDKIEQQTKEIMDQLVSRFPEMKDQFQRLLSR